MKDYINWAELMGAGASYSAKVKTARAEEKESLQDQLQQKIDTDNLLHAVYCMAHELNLSKEDMLIQMVLILSDLRDKEMQDRLNKVMETAAPIPYHFRNYRSG